jgi:hypothetical protein
VNRIARVDLTIHDGKMTVLAGHPISARTRGAVFVPAGVSGAGV